MKRFIKLFITAMFIAISPSAFPQTDQVSKTDATKMVLRDLWVDHIFWIRSVVLAKASNNKNAQQIADNQVVLNAKNIAASIEPFYGKDASDQLFKLLAGHYAAVTDYMNATFPKPNKKKQNGAADKLTANAVALADFLSGANPFLPKSTLIALLSAHGGHHISQIKEVQKKDYAGEAKTWGIMKKHIYMISDALVDGIAKQFPKKF